MRKLHIVAFMAILATASAQGQDAKVWVTKYGKKYHRANCREIKRSKSVHEITLKDAIARGFKACSVCKPGGGK